MVTIAIVITILWAKCYLGGSGCCSRPELVGDGKCSLPVSSGSKYKFIIYIDRIKK